MIQRTITALAVVGLIVVILAVLVLWKRSTTTPIPRSACDATVQQCDTGLRCWKPRCYRRSK